MAYDKCEFAARLGALEHHVARQRRAGRLTGVCAFVIGAALSATLPSLLAQPSRAGEVLTVRGLIVVDDKGSSVFASEHRSPIRS